MKKRFSQLMTQLTLLALIPIALGMSAVFVWASDISNSKYYATVIISNNSTANTNVATVANISTQNLITGGYLNSTANNTVVRNTSGADVPFQPAFPPVSDWWCFWIPSIGNDSYLTYLLYTANSSGGELRYFPDSGGMTIVDNASLEPADNFSLKTSGYFDTAAGGADYLVKTGAIIIGPNDTVDDTVDVTVLGSPDDCLDYVRGNSDWTKVLHHVDFHFTDGAGNDEPFTLIAWVNLDDATSSSILTKWKLAGSRCEWQLRTDAADKLSVICAELDDDKNIWATSAVITGDEGAWHHYAATYDGSELNTGFELYRDGVLVTDARGGAAPYAGMDRRIADVGLGARGDGLVAFLDGQMCEAKVYDVELTQPQIAADFNGEHRVADLVAYWPVSEGVGLPQDVSGNAHHAATNLADWVNTYPFRRSTFLTANPILSGEYPIEVWADSVNMYLDIDSVNEDTQALAGLSIASNANDWVIGGDSTPYIEYYEHRVGGNLVSDIEWRYAVTFEDQSGSGNPATPTFRTSSADANIIGNMTAFTPISQAQAPAYVLGPTNPFFTTAPNITGAFTTAPPTGTFPLAGVIAAVAAATSTPPQLPLLIIACFFILAASLTTSYTLRKYGSGSLIVKSIVIIAVMGIFVALTGWGIDFWMIVIFGILASAISIMSRHVAWR